MNKEDQLLKLSTTLYNQLNIIWARAIEGKGACYISSMERGDIEELLKEYNETKFPSLPAPPSSPTATAEEVLNSVALKHGHKDWELARYRLGERHLHVLILEAMTEYASLKEQEAHNRAVQECIQQLHTVAASNVQKDHSLIQDAIAELKKLKK